MENNQKQQLELIATMIQTAQRNFNENGTIYLLWGWVVAVASLVQYLSIKLDYANGAIIWIVLVPLALIVQTIIMIRRKKTQKVSTHLGKVVGYLWTAVGISLGITFFSMGTLQIHTYPVVLMLYGIGTFVSGGALQLRPMVAGAICCWVIAIISFYVNFETQLLLLSLAVILAFIVPGYLLKIRQKKHV